MSHTLTVNRRELDEYLESLGKFYCACGEQWWDLHTFRDLRAWQSGGFGGFKEMRRCLSCGTGPTKGAPYSPDPGEADV